MRILFVHQNFPGQFGHLAAALAAQGHQVVALGIEWPVQSIAGVRHLLYQPKPVGVFQSGHSLGNALLEWQSTVARGDAAAQAMLTLRNEGFVPDLIVAHPGWGEALFAKDIFPASRLLAYAEYFYGGMGCDTEFDPEFPPAPDMAQRLRIKNTHLLHGLNACDAALSPTNFQKSRHPLWAQDRIHVIHEGVDTDYFRPDPNASVQLKFADVLLQPGQEIVTFVARQLEPYRGYHVLMRALPLLQELRPHARVVIVGGSGVSYGAVPPAGTTWREIFQAEVAGQIDLERVHFVGQIAHTTLTRLMQVSAVHVYLTYPFVLSWSLLEAMSIGCLVIGSDTAPVREVIEHGCNGLLVDFFSPDALAHSIATALEQQSELVSLREMARATVQQKFDLHRLCLPRQLSLIRQLGGEG